MFFASRSQARARPERDGEKDLTFNTGGDFRFDPFAEDYEFEVELPPTRVKVRIPLSLMKPSGDSSCGMLISLGWQDSGRTLARRVFVVTVRLDQIVVTIKHETITDPEWRVNVGVNGRWLYYADGTTPGFRKDKAKTKEVGRNSRLTLNRTITLFLAQDDTISVSVHGMEQDGLGDIMELPPDRQHGNVPTEAVSALLKVLTTDFLSDRMLRGPAPVKLRVSSSQAPTTVQVPFIGRQVDWRRDLDTAADTSAAQKARTSIVARAMFLRLATVALDANDPLGLIDPNIRFPQPNFGRTNDATDTEDPLTVDEVIKEVGLGRVKRCQLTAYETEVIGRMANLVYHPRSVDYVIRYDVKVDAQP